MAFSRIVHVTANGETAITFTVRLVPIHLCAQVFYRIQLNDKML